MGELLFARGPPEQGGRKRSSDLYLSPPGAQAAAFNASLVTDHGASRTQRAAVTRVGCGHWPVATLPGAIGIAPAH
jgi:hypothetical protein